MRALGVILVCLVATAVAAIPSSLSSSVFMLPRFLIGESINWLIDLREQYPLGIVCSRLSVYLSRSNGADIENDMTLITSLQPPDETQSFSSFITDYFIANRYIYLLPVNTLPAYDPLEYGGRIAGNLVLTCQYEDEKTKSSDFGGEFILAESEPFEYESAPLSVDYFNETEPRLIDINFVGSKALEEQEQLWYCPLSCEIPATDDMILVNGERVMSADKLLQKWQQDDDSHRKAVSTISRIDRRLVEAKQKQRCIKFNHDLQTMLQATFGDDSQAASELLKAVNLKTLVVYSDALPITRQIWSQQDIEQMLSGEDSSSITLQTELDRLFGHQLTELRRQIQQARRQPSMRRLLTAGLKKSLKTFSLIALNLFRINRFGMLPMETQLVQSTSQIITVTGILTWLFQRSGLDLFDAEFQSLLLAQNRRLQCQQLRLAAGLSFGPMLPVNALLAAMDVYLTRRLVLKSLERTEQSLRRIAADIAVQRAAVSSLSHSLAREKLNE